jgi:predicted nucleic acid-binding protein
VRIALDSSVLIAAHISRAGVCAELLEDVLLHHELVISDFILEKLGPKLIEKFNFPSLQNSGSKLDGCRTRNPKGELEARL